MIKSKLFSAVGIETDEKSVRQTFEEKNSLLNAVENEDISFFDAKLEFRKNYFNLISDNYNFSDNENQSWFIKEIIDYSSSRNDITFIPCLKKISSLNNIDENSKQLAVELLNKLEYIASDSKSDNDKIISARKILNETRIPQAVEILRLLRDNSIEAKRLGIFLIGKFRIKDMIPEVCSCLNIKNLELDAYSVLNAFGNDAEKELERFFLASSGNLDTSKIALRLIGNQKTAESKSFIFSRLWSSSRQLKETAVKLLVNSDFIPTQEEKDKLHQLISETIGIIVWNLAAQVSIEKHADKFLCNAIASEANRWTDYLFDLLTITYDKKSIENIRNGTIKAASNVVIEKTIRQKLIILIDAFSTEVKLKNLSRIYPVNIHDYNNTLENIINRDYNLVGIWTKACALRNIKGLEEDTIMQSVAALMFSPEEILCEESVKVNPALYRTVSMRLPESSKIKLDKIVSGEVLKEESLFEKTSFLHKHFDSISEDKLLTLAGSLKYYESVSDDLENVIIFPCSDDNAKTAILHYDGKLNEEEIKPFYALSMDAVYYFDFYYPECSMKIFEYIKIWGR